MAGDEPSGAAGGAGPDDGGSLFTPVTRPVPIADVPQWPVERGPLPAPPASGPGTAPTTGPVTVPGPGGAGAGSRTARIGTTRFVAGAAVLLVLLAAGTTVTLLRSGRGDPARAGLPSPLASVTAGVVGATSALPVAVTTSPSASTSGPTVTTSGPTTATSSLPVTTSSPATTSRPVTSSTRPSSSTTTTSRTTTTTTQPPVTPPARSYSVSVPGDKDSVPGVAVAVGSRVVVKASGSVVVGLVQQDSCQGTTSVGPGGRRTLVGSATSCAPLSWPVESVLGSAPYGSLLARVGTGPWFAVGAGQTFTTQSGGTIAFTANDIKRSDNSGQFTVSYSVSAPA